jgi:hypothetical protein
MRLPVARTIGQVRPRIVSRLALPLEDESGYPVFYSIYNDSVEPKAFLEDGQTVGKTLNEGQTIRVVPEITAGGS